VIFEHLNSDGTDKDIVERTTALIIELKRIFTTFFRFNGVDITTTFKLIKHWTWRKMPEPINIITRLTKVDILPEKVSGMTFAIKSHITKFSWRNLHISTDSTTFTALVTLKLRLKIFKQ